jgi:hypothetical protein
MPELNQKAFKVTVGTKVEKRTSVGVSYDDFGEIVYKDDEFVVGSITDRHFELNSIYFKIFFESIIHEINNPIDYSQIP